jgi:hypothetical protein
VLPHADRIPQLDPVDGGGHHRSATVAGGGEHADHVHPLEHLAGLQKAVGIADVRAHPLIQVNLVARASLLHARECSGL